LPTVSHRKEQKEIAAFRHTYFTSFIRYREIEKYSRQVASMLWFELKKRIPDTWRVTSELSGKGPPVTLSINDFQIISDKEHATSQEGNQTRYKVARAITDDDELFRKFQVQLRAQRHRHSRPGARAHVGDSPKKDALHNGIGKIWTNQSLAVVLPALLQEACQDALGMQTPKTSTKNMPDLDTISKVKTLSSKGISPGGVAKLLSDEQVSSSSVASSEQSESIISKASPLIPWAERSFKNVHVQGTITSHHRRGNGHAAQSTQQPHQLNSWQRLFVYWVKTARTSQHPKKEESDLRSSFDMRQRANLSPMAVSPATAEQKVQYLVVEDPFYHSPSRAEDDSLTLDMSASTFDDDNIELAVPHNDRLKAQSSFRRWEEMEEMLQLPSITIKTK
jgi:hypothetical protein